MNMQEDQIIRDYLNRTQIQILQKKYNLSYTKLIKLLKSKNVYKKNFTLSYSEEKISFILENYMQIPNKEIANKLKINEDHLREIAKKLNLPKKGKGWHPSSNVDKIDFKSNEFYYFLGWLASDGNVSKDFRSIKLGITDKEIVEKFKTFFNVGEIYKNNYNNKKDLYIYCICSIKLALQLNEWGITPNKTYTLSIENNLWNSHFLRGFFEGDGHVRNTLNSNRTKRYEAGFTTASSIFALELISYLGSQDILAVLSQEKNTYRIRVSGKENLKKLYKLLYKDCNNWFLKRKKQVLDLLFSNE